MYYARVTQRGQKFLWFRISITVQSRFRHFWSPQKLSLNRMILCSKLKMVTKSHQVVTKWWLHCTSLVLGNIVQFKEKFFVSLNKRRNIELRDVSLRTQFYKKRKLLCVFDCFIQKCFYSLKFIYILHIFNLESWVILKSHLMNLVCSILNLQFHQIS